MFSIDINHKETHNAKYQRKKVNTKQ